MTHERTGAELGARQERRDAVANRTRILAAARQLFAEQGVDATSMNQVAQAAQVGPGTLYRHFAHKGELCGALLADDITAFQEQVSVIVTGSDVPALTRLERVLDALTRMIESHVPLLTGMQESAGPRRHEVYQIPFYTQLHGRVAQLLEEAMARGEATELDVDFTADAIFAAVAPPLFVFQQQQRGFSRERILAAVRRLFIDGLRSSATSPERNIALASRQKEHR